MSKWRRSICATFALSRSARGYAAAVQAVTMPGGRSLRRCRCHLYCTNTIGPHDTHSDLAISRSGRYDLRLGETVASSQKEDCIGGDVSVSTPIGCKVYDCAIGEEYPQVKQSESITQSAYRSQRHPAVVPSGWTWTYR
jgi:hypothetical protein